jgi:drug/metabolite transporter (DMT)-like permease
MGLSCLSRSEQAQDQRMSRTSNPVLGITLMVIGTLMLTVQDAASKWLITDHSVGEILFYRGIWAYVPIAWFVWRGGGRRLLISRRPGANIVRGLLNSAAGLCIISAYVYMPLASANAVMFCSPLVVAMLSGALLGERVGRPRWAAVAVGFVGVLFILNPSQADLQWFLALPVGAAIFVALRDIMTRRLGATDDPSTILLYTVTLSVATGAAWIAWFGATWPSNQAWLWFISMGIVNGLAHYCVIKAFSLARAATVTPLRYLSLVWAGFIGFVVWGDVPSALAGAGAVLVVASGVALLIWEGRARRN